MPRTSMAALITRTRRLIGDPAGASQVWSDDEIQDALDAHRTDVRYLELREAETIQSGGGVVYLNYYAPFGDWEDDETLTYGGTWATVTPSAQDLLIGKWTFSSNQNPPVYLTGKSFDLYGAAADLLEAWAAKAKLEYTFSPDRGQFVRSQKHQMLLTQAATYRAKQRVASVALVRSDVC